MLAVVASPDETMCRSFAATGKVVSSVQDTDLAPVHRRRARVGVRSVLAQQLPGGRAPDDGRKRPALGDAV